MPAFPSMLATRLYALEGGADPSANGKAGWATDMILKALDEFQFLEVHIGTTAPATTEEVWLTLDAGNAQGGTVKLYDTVSSTWLAATPALFAALINRLIGASSSSSPFAEVTPTAVNTWDGLADGIYEVWWHSLTSVGHVHVQQSTFVQNLSFIDDEAPNNVLGQLQTAIGQRRIERLLLSGGQFRANISTLSPTGNRFSQGATGSTTATGLRITTGTAGGITATAAQVSAKLYKLL